MILPTIHLNGTSPEMLKKDYLKTWGILGEARDALQAVEFNGRDYYPQGPEAWAQARAEHRDRFARIDALRAELMEILEHLQTPIDEKAQRERERLRLDATSAAEVTPIPQTTTNVFYRVIEERGPYCRLVELPDGSHEVIFLQPGEKWYGYLTRELPAPTP